MGLLRRLKQHIKPLFSLLSALALGLLLFLVMIALPQRAGFAQQPVGTGGAAIAPAVAHLRQQVHGFHVMQNGAEADWRHHHSLLVDRAASAGERQAALAAEAVVGRDDFINRFRSMAAQARQTLAQTQALVDALPPGTTTVPPGVATLMSQTQTLLSQESALWQEYENQFHSAAALASTVTSGPRGFLNTIERAWDNARNGGDHSIFSGRPLPRSQRPRPTARRAVPASTSTSAGYYTDRSHLMPDAEDTVLASANDDLQNWMAARQRALITGAMGRNPSAINLPHLYVPHFVNDLIESEFIRTRGVTAQQRSDTQRLFNTRLDFYRTIAASTADPLLRIRRVLAQVVSDYLRPYNRDVRTLMSAFNGEGVNCQGRANLLYGVMSALNLELPRGWTLGVQMFARHMELVLYNPQAHPPVIQLYSQRQAELTGPVYHPAILLTDFIRTRSESAPDTLEHGQLLMAPADRRFARASNSTGARSLPPPSDGLGNTLPVPDADFMDGPIPRYAMNEAPQPDGPLGAPVANRSSNSLGQPTTLAEIRQQLALRNPLLTRDNIASFCYDFKYSRDAAPASAHQQIENDFRQRALFAIPALGEIERNPEVIFQNPALYLLLEVSRPYDGCLYVLLNSLRLREKIRQFGVDLFHQGRLSELLRLTVAGPFVPENQACRLLSHVNPESIQITENPSAATNRVPLNPSTSRAGARSTARVNEYIPAELHIDAANLSQSPRQVATSGASGLRNTSIFSLTDVEGYLFGACFSGDPGTSIDPFYGAVVSYSCTENIPLRSIPAFAVGGAYFMAMSALDLDGTVRLLAGCSNNGLQRAALNFQRYFPFSAHCAEIFPEDTYPEDFFLATRQNPGRRRARGAALNRFINFLNVRVPTAHIPRLNENDCPMPVIAPSTQPQPTPDGSGNATGATH